MIGVIVFSQYLHYPDRTTFKGFYIDHNIFIHSCSSFVIDTTYINDRILVNMNEKVRYFQRCSLIDWKASFVRIDRYRCQTRGYWKKIYNNILLAKSEQKWTKLIFRNKSFWFFKASWSLPNFIIGPVLQTRNSFGWSLSTSHFFILGNGSRDPNLEGWVMLNK